jgi:hypothetical protein
MNREVHVRICEGPELRCSGLLGVVVNDEEKASEEASGRDREDERKRIADDVSKLTKMTSEPGRHRCSGKSLAGAC